MILGEWKGVRAESTVPVAANPRPGAQQVIGAAEESEAIMNIVSEAVRGTSFEFKDDGTWTSLYESSDGKARGRGVFSVDREEKNFLLTTAEGPHAGESTQYEIIMLTRDTLKFADDNGTAYVYARSR